MQCPHSPEDPVRAVLVFALETRKRSEANPAACVVACACEVDAAENPSFAAEFKFIV